MNYTEQKAKEIWGVFGQGNADVKWLEGKIKEIIRDARHKIAENLILDGNEKAMDAAHNIVMNTNLD